MNKSSRLHRTRRLFAEPLEDRRVMSADLGVAPEWFGDRDEAANVLGENGPICAVNGLGQPGLIVVEGNTLHGQSLQTWLAEQSFFESFEPNQVIRVEPLQTSASPPNDSLFDQQWGLHNTGQTGGTFDADIDAPEAWELTTGGQSDFVVGVIDSGVDYTHPDLRNNIWTNPGEVAGNGVDDDGNGFVDDVHGYDFYWNDADPFDDNLDGHGTHVSGTIAAERNNGVGVTGVDSSNASIMALKFVGPFGSGSLSGAIAAINYATMMRRDFGVDIRLTNNSWGGGGYSQELRDAIEKNGETGMLFVAAAGNSNNDNDEAPSYPASFDLDNIISVAASDHNDQIAGFSNYGAQSVDLAAPGVGILSTIPGNRYDSLQGTSMAAPHVSGVAALAWSFNDGATAADIKQAILDGADDLPNPSKLTLTNGRLNARNTLELLDKPAPIEIDLSVSVARSSPTLVAGDAAAPGPFNIKVTNACAADAHSVVVLVGEIGGAANVKLDSSLLPSNVTWNASKNRGEWHIDEISASGSMTLTLTFLAAADAEDGGRVIAAALIQSADEQLINTGDDFALKGAKVERRVDLSVHAIPIGGATVVAGETVDVIFGVVNHGPSNASAVSLLVGRVTRVRSPRRDRRAPSM